MNTTPALRRQSLLDHGTTGAAAPSSSVAATTTAAAAAETAVANGNHSGSHPTFLMTSAVSQSRRPSVANTTMPSIVVSRAYDNTYQTQPEKPFSAVAAEKVLREVMEDMLQGRQYDQDACKQLTTTLADTIKKRVKELGHPRYKLVTNVAIGQAQDASISFASRCVWNDNFDSFAEYTYRNGSLYAIGLVHALYCD